MYCVFRRIAQDVRLVLLSRHCLLRTSERTATSLREKDFFRNYLRDEKGWMEVELAESDKKWMQKNSKFRRLANVLWASPALPDKNRFLISRKEARALVPRLESKEELTYYGRLCRSRELLQMNPRSGDLSHEIVRTWGNAGFPTKTLATIEDSLNFLAVLYKSVNSNIPVPLRQQVIAFWLLEKIESLSTREIILLLFYLAGSYIDNRNIGVERGAEVLSRQYDEFHNDPMGKGLIAYVLYKSTARNIPDEIQQKLLKDAIKWAEDGKVHNIVLNSVVKLMRRYDKPWMRQKEWIGALLDGVCTLPQTPWPIMIWQSVAYFSFECKYYRADFAQCLHSKVYANIDSLRGKDAERLLGFLGRFQSSSDEKSRMKFASQLATVFFRPEQQSFLDEDPKLLPAAAHALCLLGASFPDALKIYERVLHSSHVTKMMKFSSKSRKREGTLSVE